MDIDIFEKYFKTNFENVKKKCIQEYSKLHSDHLIEILQKNNPNNKLNSNFAHVFELSLKRKTLILSEKIIKEYCLSKTMEQISRDFDIEMINKSMILWLKKLKNISWSDWQYDQPIGSISLPTEYSLIFHNYKYAIDEQHEEKQKIIDMKNIEKWDFSIYSRTIYRNLVVFHSKNKDDLLMPKIIEPIIKKYISFEIKIPDVVIFDINF